MIANEVKEVFDRVFPFQENVKVKSHGENGVCVQVNEIKYYAHKVNVIGGRLSQLDSNGDWWTIKDLWRNAYKPSTYHNGRKKLVIALALRVTEVLTNASFK